MVFRVIGWVLKLLPVVIFALAFLKLNKYKRNLDFARLKESMDSLKKRWVQVLICTCVFMLLCMLNSYLYTLKNPTLSIKYNYAEASKGQNPNGTRFNPSEIISDDILQEVILRGNYNITVEDLSSTLTLENEFDEQELNTAEPEKSLMATEYTVVYTPSFYTMGIDGKEMINLLANVYYETYLEHYTENNEILDITFDDIDNLDYSNMPDYLDQKASILSQFVTNYANENANFHLENGENFWAIESKINTFREVEIEKFASFIKENGLSKDAANYKIVKDYQNKLLQKEYDYQMAYYNVNLEAVDKYDPKMATIVLVPSQNMDNEYYMGRTKIGPDDFTNAAMGSLSNASEIQLKIKTNNYYIERVTTSEAGPEDYITAESMLAGIKEQLLKYSQECRDTSDAYISVKRKGYMQLFMNAKSLFASLQLKKNLIFAALFLGCVVTFYIAGYIARIANRRGERK